MIFDWIVLLVSFPHTPTAIDKTDGLRAWRGYAVAFTCIAVLLLLVLVYTLLTPVASSETFLAAPIDTRTLYTHQPPDTST